MLKKVNFICILLLMFSVSCSRDEVSAINDASEKVNYSEVKKSQLTEAEMLQKGWKIVDEFKLSGNNSLRANYSSPNEEREIPFKSTHLMSVIQEKERG